MKSAYLILVCVAFSIMAVAQKKTPKNNTKSISVPNAVSASFQGKFTDVNKQKWSKKSGGNYVAAFLNNEKVKQEVEFDAEGNQVKSRATFAKDQVPEVVTSALAKAHADAEVLEVQRLEIAGVSPYYKVKIKDGVKGKFLLVSDAGDVSE